MIINPKKQMSIDEICGHIIQLYYNDMNKSNRVMSRQKLPCTRCKTTISTTWRPGPCGTSSLCNACGLMYMKRGERPRMIDLFHDDGRTIWMERDSDSLQWRESSFADMKDQRIQHWSRHEEERVEIIHNNKRKFVDL